MVISNSRRTVRPLKVLDSLLAVSTAVIWSPDLPQLLEAREPVVRDRDVHLLRCRPGVLRGYQLYGLGRVIGGKRQLLLQPEGEVERGPADILEALVHPGLMHAVLHRGDLAWRRGDAGNDDVAKTRRLERGLGSRAELAVVEDEVVGPGALHSGHGRAHHRPRRHLGKADGQGADGAPPAQLLGLLLKAVDHALQR